MGPELPKTPDRTEPRPRGLFILDADAYAMVYGPQERQEIAAKVDLVAPPLTRDSIHRRMELLADVDVLFTGWGAPLLDEAFLNAAPNLKAMFYAAGSVAGCITPAVWERGIIVTSAYAANAVPVAEYTLAMTLFALKHGLPLARATRGQRAYVDRNGAPGCYGSTVGLISLGVTGRHVIKLLQPFDLKVIAYDPFVSDEEARALGIEMVCLEDVFHRGDIVTLHAPLLEETEEMIHGSHFALMKPGATFINTARGQLVREAEMIEVLTRRPDLQAVLDVATQEPPDADSPLYTLPNVLLTPHIAGSVGVECRRMGRYMVDELHRYLTCAPLHWSITPELALRSSHRPVSIRGKPQTAVRITNAAKSLLNRQPA